MTEPHRGICTFPYVAEDFHQNASKTLELQHISQLLIWTSRVINGNFKDKKLPVPIRDRNMLFVDLKCLFSITLSPSSVVALELFLSLELRSMEFFSSVLGCLFISNQIKVSLKNK